MADDTNGQTTGAPGPADHRPDERIVEPVPAETSGAVPHPTSGRTVWTASDARGPLNAAPPLRHDPLTHDEIEAEPTSGDDILEPASEPATPAAEASTTAVPETTAPRRSLLPVAAGVVIGAIIGAGSAYFVYDLQSTAPSGADQKLAQLSGRIDALEQRADPQASIQALKTSVADLGGKVAALQKAPAASTAPVSASAAPAATAPAFDASALQQKIAALQASLTGLQSNVESLKTQGADLKSLQAGLAGANAAIAGVQKQASGAQTGVEAIQGQQRSFEGRISAPALAVVADSLVQQIDQGQPYAQQVDALVTLGADPARIAILRENARKGVPSAKALAAQFAPLAEPILATEHKVAANAGLLDRLKSGMSSMVSIRNTSDTTGNDLGAQVSRIEADLTHDDVAGAYASWAALPADARAKSDAWGALAKTAAEAIEAARIVQQGAIASLGSRKS